MNRFLSTAGVAVYVLAVSTAFPSVQDAWSALGSLAPAAIAAEASPEAAGASEAAAEISVSPDDVASTTPVWNTDDDGMLMDEAQSDEPFQILNPV